MPEVPTCSKCKWELDSEMNCPNYCMEWDEPVLTIGTRVFVNNEKSMFAGRSGTIIGDRPCPDGLSYRVKFDVPVRQEIPTTFQSKFAGHELTKITRVSELERGSDEWFINNLVGLAKGELTLAIKEDRRVGKEKLRTTLISLFERLFK